jgi:large subunit ribosomal protein L7/L12
MKTLVLLALLGADSVWLTQTGDKKIMVIKEVREATGLGLADAKKLVESTPQKVKSGLSRSDADALVAKLKAAGATAEVRGDDGAAASAPAKDATGEYHVKLESFGQAKIQCIKVVKDNLGLGLKESKELVESAPVVVKKGLSREAAEALAKQLNDVGGKAAAGL